MMGTKTLSEIKAEIRHAFARKGMDVETWLDHQMAKVQRGPRPDAGFVQSLRKVHDALRRALVDKSTRSGKNKRPNGKKKPAA